jgi:hypothetical protein
MIRGWILGRHRKSFRLGAVLAAALLVGGSVLDTANFLGDGGVGAATLGSPSRSTTIALTSDETRLVVVNREANSLSIIQVKDAQGGDVAIKLDEIAVGLEHAAWQSTRTTRWRMSPTASVPRSR